jgi:excisionase family DNA binding protein
MIADLSNEIIEIKQNLAKLTVLFLSQKKVLTFNEFCEYVGISKSHGYQLTSNNRVPFYKPNNKMVYFERSEIDTWLLQNRITPNVEIDQKAVDYVVNNRK